MKDFRTILIAALLTLPVTSAHVHASASESGPSRLKTLSMMGSVKDLGNFGADFEGDCPALVSHQMLTTLLNAPVTKKEREGFPYDYLEKQMIQYDGRVFSANIKNDLNSPLMYSVLGYNKPGTQLFGVLAKREELRDQDTNAVRQGASLCRYQIFYMNDQSGYVKLMTHLADGLRNHLYGEFSVLHKDIVKEGGTPVDVLGTVNVAVSQPRR